MSTTGTLAHETFTFKSYQFDADQKIVTFQYAYDTITFTETFGFDFDFADYNPQALDRALQTLFFIAGVSYFKVYAPPKIEVLQGSIDEALADFLNRTYQNGLGEFFFVNKLDPRMAIQFPVNAPTLPTLNTGTDEPRGLLVGIGGGKDSLVSVELLRGKVDKLATWSVNHKPQLSPLVERIGLPHFWVERNWDQQLLTLKDDPEAYNGHIPISAIFAGVGTIVAILTGYQDAVVSNEQSANEPTLEYDGIAINHQYSKSQAFEADYQHLLQQSFGANSRYYSFLRPLSELHIAEVFSRHGYDKYHDVFSSCNRAFTHDSDHMFWDGTCAKCAFVFLALTPFIERERLEKLFHGKNLLLDKSLEPTYRQLLGIEGDKPLDCVGEIKESRAAMRLSKEIYPELTRYEFEIPAEYDYQALASHHMPDEAYDILRQSLNS